MKKLLAAVVMVIGPMVLIAGGASAQGAPPLRGEVLEVIDVDAYTYLRLRTAGGEVWAAVGKVPAKAGDQVAIIDPVVMEDFESKTLQRTFPTIVFGTVGAAAEDDVSDSADPANPHSPHAAAHPGTDHAAMPLEGTPPTSAGGTAHVGDVGQIHGSIGKSVDVDVVKVAKAEGPTGRTIAEVNANRAALKDKTVTIHAKVVKVNTNVMGKNWVHLRDGSGSAADASNDLLVTSKEEPKVGDIVIAKGVVKTDVDLGSGYAYKVLVDDVSFQK